MTNTHAALNKQIAQRTCVACRQIKAKRELVRLVRTPEGTIEIDSTGKKVGRGAYLCPNRGCWEKALKGKQMEHALRGGLSGNNCARLFEYSKELPKGVG
jgi:hypothetical protein